MEGIILAAGLSSRLPAYKLTQVVKDKPLLLHTLDTMLMYCTKIYIVTGHKHKQIENLVKDYKNVVCVLNHVYEEGMFSSVKLGVSQTNDDFFMIPADCPFVLPSTYESLLENLGQVIIPSYDFKAGHPIRISHQLKNSILESDKPHLRAFLNEYDKVYVTVDDPYILVDIDTPEDLNKVRGYLE
jgi:molybdenum cofactor cytidylyltransferase